jgi:hypothetical protein
MPAAIVFTQGSRVSQPGHPLGVEPNELVVCTNVSAASLYMWKLLDVPIRSQLTRNLSGEANTFSFTPDVPGTYLISLQINNSNIATENTTSFVAILTSGDDRMGWRYRAAGETNEDIVTSHDFEGNSLGFPNDVNPRGWASRDDIEREQIEKAVRRVTDATVTAIAPGSARILTVNPQTGKLDPSVLPTVVHNQVQPSDTWLINHNLGKHPNCVITDSAGNVVRGDEQHLSLNQVRLTFNGAFSGTVTCS